MNDRYPVRSRLPDGEVHDELTEKVIGAAIEVHRVLGPGLTEVIYERALCRELDLRGIAYERQFPIEVDYKGVNCRRNSSGPDC